MSSFRELSGRASYVENSKPPSDLDYLIHTLRNPNETLTVQNVLGYIYNYLPYVKHEHNLRVVFSSFLNNQTVFGSPAPTFEQTYLIIEVFKLIADKKVKISQPTLPVKTFYDVIGKELENFVAFDPVANSWKALPIIAGMFLSQTTRDDVLTRVNVFEYKMFFRNWDTRMDRIFKSCFQNSIYGAADQDTVYLSLLSLAVKFRQGQALKEYIGRVSPSYLVKLLCKVTLDSDSGSHAYMSFAETSSLDPKMDEFLNANVLQRPVLKHMSRLSFLLEAAFQELPYSDASFELISDVLREIVAYDKEMADFTAAHPLLNQPSDKLHENDHLQQQFWVLMKTILFSRVVMFQGLLTRFTSFTNSSTARSYFGPKRLVRQLEDEYREFSLQILHSLYYLNFVLNSIGQGGFDSYNFVYYVSVEIGIQNNRNLAFEKFTSYLIGDYRELNLHPESLNNDYVARTKVLFVLGLWENYLLHAHERPPQCVQFIYETTFGIASNSHYTDFQLIEAAHSVLLVYFSKFDNTHETLHRVLQYFELLTGQFPRILSANQLSVAVETLGKKILLHPVPSKPVLLYSHSVDEFLSSVFFKCSNTVSGHLVRNQKSLIFSSAQPISEISAQSTMSHLKKDEKADIIKENKSKKPKDLAFVDVLPTSQGHLGKQHFEERKEPESSREAIVSAFFNVIPYLPIDKLVFWLDKMWMLVTNSNNDEYKFLAAKLWSVISLSLDLNRSEIAYTWWYEKKRAVERNLLNSPEVARL